MRVAPNIRLNVPNFLPYSRSHKEYIFIKTARRWPWKLVFAKECVTTHSPNENVSKMDGAKGEDLYRIEEENWDFPKFIPPLVR